MIERVVSTIQLAASHIQICLGAPVDPIDNRYVELARTRNAVIAFDKTPGHGPLGGILTALDEVRSAQKGKARGERTAVIVVAWHLAIHHNRVHRITVEETSGWPGSITVPCDPDGRVHPLCGIYSVSCLPAVELSLNEGRLRVDSVWDPVETWRFEYAEYAHLEGPGGLLTNVNTKSTLDRLQTEW